MRYKGLFRPAELLDFDTGEWKEPDTGKVEVRNKRPKVKKWMD
jgi:hypothetical protein